MNSSRLQAGHGRQGRSNEVALRIAFFIRALDGGGAQRDTILLANEIATRGHSVELLTLVSDGPLRALVGEDVAIVRVPGRRLRFAVAGLWRALIDRRPQVLVSAEAAPNLVAVLVARLVPSRLRPRVVLREVSSPSIAERLDPFRQNRVAYRLLHLGYRWADVVVTLTEGALRDLAENFHVPRDKLARLRANAVIDESDLGEMGEGTRERGLLVSVGRLSPEKDHFTLLKAFAKLDRKGGQRLEIVGAGPLRPEIEALIAELELGDRVTLRGFVPNPFSVFRRAQVAICSSRYEGFGNALVEALACGTAVVSTDCPYGPREILAGGRYGLLVPVGDCTALARAIAQAMVTPTDQALLRARAAAHTVSRGADALLDAITR